MARRPLYTRRATSLFHVPARRPSRLATAGIQRNLAAVELRLFQDVNDIRTPRPNLALRLILRVGVSGGALMGCKTFKLNDNFKWSNDQPHRPSILQPASLPCWDQTRGHKCKTPPRRAPWVFQRLMESRAVNVSLSMD